MSEGVGHLLWIAALGVTTLFAVWHRVLQDTPLGHFHRKFQEWKQGREYDAAEKIRRVRLLTGVFLNISRVAWIVLCLVAWLKLWKTDEGPLAGDAGIPLISGLLVGVMLTSIFVLDLFPQVLSSWRGERIATASLRLLCAIESLFSPVSRGLRSLTRATVRLIGAGEERSEADIVEEGIRAAVEQGEREGVLFEGEKSMIESVLEFHDAEVREVMTPRTEMIAADASTTIEDMVQRAIACGHSRIPVFRENIDNIVGIVYTKDLLRYVTDPKQSQLPVEEIHRKIYFVPESKKIRELLAEFRAERFHIAVVLDEYGGTIGLVTIEDIIEELVGEIEDEYDAAGAALIRRVDQNTFDLDGRAHIDEVSKALGVELPESDDYETIAGFIFSSLGRVPKEGDFFDLEQLRFKVTAADERKIKRVRVQILRVQGQEVA